MLSSVQSERIGAKRVNRVANVSAVIDVSGNKAITTGFVHMTPQPGTI